MHHSHHSHHSHHLPELYGAPCMLQLTVDTALLTEVRQLVAQICGDALQFMRIEACEHGARIRIWLCLGRELAEQMMEVTLRALPQAEFGRLVTRQRGLA